MENEDMMQLDENIDDQEDEYSNDDKTDENDDISINEVMEQEPIEKHLEESIISNCISMVCKTADGMDFAFVQLYCVNKSLTNIEIMSRYVHLRYINFSNNCISDISPLSSLTNLITLDCSFNRIEGLCDMDLPYLKKLNLSNNRITNLNILSFPQLETLNLNENKISSLYNNDNQTALQSDKLPDLENLELRGNKLVDTSGLENLKNVKSIFLSKNKISKVCGMENLINLTSLHLRDNKISLLDGFSNDLQSLQYLNIRGNQLENIEEIKKLKVLPMLRALVVSGNLVSEADDYRLEVLIALRTLVRLDKDNFLDEERTEAEQIYQERFQEELLEDEKSKGDNDDEE